MKKRFTAMILSLCMVLMLLPGAARSLEDDDLSRYGEAAEALWEDGLFLGSGTSFALDQPLTRAAGVTLVVRLLGAESVALEGEWSTPFTDVPDWATPYVGYAYTEALVNGTGAGSFSPNDQMTANQYLTLLLRALGYDDGTGDFSWKNADVKALELGLASPQDLEGVFLRGQAALFAYNALSLPLKGTTASLRSTIQMPGRPDGDMPAWTDSVLPSTEQDPEIQKALELGIVPVQIQGRYEDQITYSEFSSLLDEFISLMFPDKLNDWKKASALYREAQDSMCRMEGTIVFLYAAECAGIDAMGYQNMFSAEGLSAENGGDFWAGLTWDYPLLPDRDKIYYNEILAASDDCAWRCEEPYYNNAVHFAEYISYGNGRTYFDFGKDFSLRLADPFTCGEAIQAVERLYETSRFGVYVPVEETVSGITAETLTLAAAMPEASYDNLPDWRGHTIQNRMDIMGCGYGMNFREDEVAAIAACGFNFSRVPLNACMLFDAEGTDTSRVNRAYLETMDDLVNWCAQYGIHICFDLHDMPGFYTGGYDESRNILFWDEDSQTILREFWTFLAEHYKEVPSNLLSFNLLNEPHSNGTDELTDELYSAVMLPVIEAIREVTPDRLIFVDMLGIVSGRPVEGLADAQVAQATHPYFLADNAVSWPAAYINGFVNKDSGTLTLNGTFPAGTEVSISMFMAHSVSELTLLADGKAVGGFPVGGEAIDEDGCASIMEEGGTGEYRRYRSGEKTYAFTVGTPCKTLQLEQIGDGMWYALDYIKVKTPDQEMVILANNNFVDDDMTPVLTIATDGTVTAQREETLLLMDKSALEKQFQAYSEFAERTGETVMVQEFGFNRTIPLETSLAAAEDFFSVLDTYDIPWCCWADEFGVVILEEDLHALMNMDNPHIHEDGTYTTITDGWQVLEEMLEVYQRHMNRH